MPSVGQHKPANPVRHVRLLEVTMAPSQDAAADRSHIVEANGVKVHYRVDGQGDPLVLLHAGTLSADMWQPYLAAFTQHYRVITPDMRGHGRSDNPKGAMTYRQLADEIVAFAWAVDLREPLIVGFSDGGQVGLEIRCAIPTSPGPLSWVASGSSSPRRTGRGCGTPSVTRSHLRWIPRARHGTIPIGWLGSSRYMDR